MATTKRITTGLWFDSQAEEAARFYTGIFRNSKINVVTRFPDAGQEVHHQPAGTVMVVAFELDGHAFTALNGGPQFKFTEAISMQVNCADQKEIDYYWEKLSAGGDPQAQQCGWLKDRYGLSWQVVPDNMDKLFAHETSAGTKRAMEAMLQMKKLDIAALERARDGAA